jgi:hypothetical protein
VLDFSVALLLTSPVTFSSWSVGSIRRCVCNKYLPRPASCPQAASLWCLWITGGPNWL